jgi:glycosyltransferase involved in cell wall biosynthesis
MAKKAKTQKSKKYPLDIILCADGMPFHGNSIKEHSLGGSETSALQIAKSLAKIGNNVTVFSHCKDKEGDYDGVRYLDLSGFLQYATVMPHDVLIVERIPELFTHRFNSKVNILWQHDLSVFRNADRFKAGIWNTDRCFVMSEFQRRQSMDINGTPENYYYITRNGVDLDLFKGEQPKRDPKKLICGARPERGLDNLLFHIMPRLLDKDKDIKLYLASYDHKVPEMEGFYGSLREQAAKFSNNVEWLPALTKKELYEHYKTASLYIYPSDFEEIYCISALESMTCGLPFVGRDNAALKETLHPDAGILLSGFDTAKNPEFLNQFSDTVLNLLANPGLRDSMGKAGRKHAKECDWDFIAKEWIEEIYKIFKANTDNKYTLAKNFIFHSDIISAKKVTDSLPEDSPGRKMLKQDMEPWERSFEGYDSVGKMEDNNVFNYLNDIGDMEGLLKITQEKSEPHWPMLDQWLLSHPEVKKFIDYGCFTGRYAIPLANKDKDYFVYGVDVSRKTLDIAEQISSKLSKHSNIKFIQSSYEQLSSAIEEKVDCILMFDILEHIIEPEKMIDKMEKFLNKDGWVIIITPAGPMEADGYGLCPHRIHLHEYSISDLRDMFGKKKNFGTTYMAIPGGSKVDNSKFGKICTTYQKSGIKTGKIDYNRKLLVQKPKQTLSACLITKDEANNIGRCLDKIKDYVDEIIVCDTGSIDKTKKIAESLGARVIEGSDPLVYGFETSRNESIKEALGDWIMWIDADEQLQDGKNLGKYLRNNIFDAYSIRQHHFSCSPPNAFKPDMPCRLFRNKKDIHFFGMIHEHPETDLNKGPGLTTVLNDLEIAHGGYYTETVRRKRFERNFPLMVRDRQKYPDRMLGKFFEIRDLIHLARYKLEQTKGQVSQEVAQWCHTAVDLYRKNFLGENHLMSSDAINFYSDALRILGLGFEMTSLTAFGKDKAELNGNNPKTIRFLNSEDAEKYFSSIIKTNTKHYESKYF